MIPDIDTIGHACGYLCAGWTFVTSLAAAWFVLTSYRIGGLTFFRLGALGGSVYVSRRSAR